MVTNFAAIGKDFGNLTNPQKFNAKQRVTLL